MIFYCLNYLHYIETEDKRESHKKVRENKGFCNVIMPSEDTKMLKFNQYQMSDEVLFVIYADLECLVEKIGGCKNNSESSYTTAYWVFQCLQYHHVKAQKISMMYTEANVV